jgi:hypothetical protein
MASYFEALPPEMVEQIVSSLPLRDIASLRLTSRTAKNKASQQSFTSYFKHKNIDVTTGSLQNFERMTRPGCPGRLLRYCTITGISLFEGAVPDVRDYVENPATDNNAEHLHFLTEAFRNLKENNPHASLVSLSLGVDVRIEGPDGEATRPESFRCRSAVWNAAMKAFNLTVAALDSSQLPVTGKLDIFTSLRCCSLAWTAFQSFVRNFASTDVFRTLKKLSVSLSAWPKTTIRVPHEDGWHNYVEVEVDARFHSNTHQTSILRDIFEASRIMPSLEGLDLHWYNAQGDPYSPPSPSITPQEVVVSRPPMSLAECILRGVYTSEADLLHFLKTVRPGSVSLTNVQLVSGAYVPIFDYLAVPDSPVETYHLDDLVEPGGKLVHFEVPGRPKFPYMNDTPGPSTLIRQGRQVKDVIKYRWARWRALGSGPLYRWSASRSQEYGWGGTGSGDFITLNGPKWVNMSPALESR